MNAVVVPTLVAVGCVSTTDGEATRLCAQQVLLRSWTGESDVAYARLGELVASAGDVNGDGYDEVILSREDSVVGVDRAQIHDGSPTGPIREPSWTADFDERLLSLRRAGDLDDDGFDDLLAVMPYRSEVYGGSPDGLSVTPSWTFVTDGSGVLLPPSTPAGDVNGDGFDDMVGAEWAYGPEGIDIRASVYLGSPVGPTLTSRSTSPPVDGAPLSSIHPAGDVNGDGFDDVIVGARSYDDVEDDQGFAALLTGSAEGLRTEVAWVTTVERDDAAVGAAASGAGDVNADGFDDVLVAAPGYDEEEDGDLESARVMLYLGSPTGLDTSHTWTLDDTLGALYEPALAAAGDVDDDGYDDIAVRGTFPDAGTVAVYLGGPSGPPEEPSWSDVPETEGEYDGGSVAGLDVNGDGYGDVLVGAPADFTDQAGEGRAFVYAGSCSHGTP